MAVPIYKYKAQTGDGKKIRGVMEAPDETEVYNRVRAGGSFVLSVSEEQKKYRGKKLRSKALGEFCRQLGTLLAAGVSLVRALSIISQDETTPETDRAIYGQLLWQIRQGTPLSEAMEAAAPSFPDLLVYMIRSAEASGGLDKTALRMAGHYEKEYKLNKKVSGAMVYPCILMVLLILVVIFIVAFIIPQFKEIFDLLPELPGATKLLLAISDLFQYHWPLLLVCLFVIVIALTIALRFHAVRYRLDQLKLKLPVFGKLLKVIYTARFARTMSSLYSAGLPIVSALSIGSRTIGNLYVEEQFENVIARVRSGENLSQSLAGVDGFMKKLSSAIMIGEETGSLDKMLDSIADTLEYESEMAISKMVTMMEPALIILMALIVGFVMMAVLIPVFNSYGAIENTAYI